MYIDDLTDAVVACAESKGWTAKASINYKEQKSEFEFSKFSPAGRDFSFTAEMKCANINSLIEHIDNYYEDFDVDYETYLWLDQWGHGKNGAPYRLRAVLEDAEAIGLGRSRCVIVYNIHMFQKQTNSLFIMRNNLLHSDIIGIAVRQGWLVSVTASGENTCYFDFQRRTLGGLPFCLTAELSDGLVGTLVDEIIYFVDELDPERYAGEWLEASGQVSPTRYLRAVTDMDDIRTSAWLLVIDLSELAEKQNQVLALPWYLWN